MKAGIPSHHLTATEYHLPYGITQCYLPPDTSEHTPPSPQSGRYSIYFGGMEGWVDLGDLLHTELIYQPADGHPSMYKPGPVSINFVDQANAANHYTTPPPHELEIDVGLTASLYLADQFWGQRSRLIGLHKHNTPNELWLN